MMKYDKVYKQIQTALYSLIALAVSIIIVYTININSGNTSKTLTTEIVEDETISSEETSKEPHNDIDIQKRVVIELLEDDDCDIEPLVEDGVDYIDKYTLISLSDYIFEIEEVEEHMASPEIVNDFVVFKSVVADGKEIKFKLSEKTQKTVYEISKKYNLPYRVILGLLGVETFWNEDKNHIETHDGARYIGIGCIAERHHAERLKKNGIDIYTLEGNIEGICYLLNEHMNNFDNNIVYALMAYNGGASYARSKISDGIENTSYTRKIMAYADSLK